MADPTLGLGMLSTFGLASSLFGNKGGDAPAPAAAAAPAALPPDPSTPAIAPGSKPAKKSQQQSFLSGAAGLQRPSGQASGVSGGKTLLGQ